MTQIVMRGKRVGIVETCGKKLAQKKRTNVFFVSETNLYIYTVISAHGQNTELNLTTMNSNAECLSVCVCVSASVGGKVSSSMDVLSLAALLLTHCSLMFTQLFSAAIFSVEYLKYEACLQEFIMCMFKCNIHKTVPVYHT